MSDTQHKDPRTPSVIKRATEKREARIELRAERRQEGELTGQRARSATERLLERVLYGALYSVAVVACFFLGPIPTAVIVAAMSWLCASEFFHLMRIYGRMPNEVIGLSASVVFPAAAFFGYKWLGLSVLVLFFTLAFWYVSNPRSSIADVAVTFFGACYCGLLFSTVVLLRGAVDGAWLCFGVVGSIWLNDSFAYLVGSAIGSHKMAPKISPKKSWEGAIGGFVGCMLVWGVLSQVWSGGLSLPLALLCGAFVCVASVFGDLVESRIKRGAGVKDSGNVMPGHGGMLDRSDSLLFGCSCAFMILLIGGIL